ncbi:MAG: hypothetical protein R6X02_06655 [Enhygromyxa sp.]
MNFRAFASLAALLVLPLGPLGCVEAPQRSASADEAPAKAEQQAKPATKSADPKQLSPEELELIAADPKDLSPEQRRKRAFALRKQIMQDPDSPQAQALEEARAAVLNGELPPEHVNPEGAAKNDPGLVIELPEHLQDQRVSKDEPAE